MEPIEFVKKWELSKKDLAELLGLKQAQVDRWFFPAEAKNHQVPKQSHLDRLSEIDLLLTLRDAIEDAARSPTMERISQIIPSKKSK